MHFYLNSLLKQPFDICASFSYELILLAFFVPLLNFLQLASPMQFLFSHLGIVLKTVVTPIYYCSGQRLICDGAQFRNFFVFVVIQILVRIHQNSQTLNSSQMQSFALFPVIYRLHMWCSMS